MKFFLKILLLLIFLISINNAHSEDEVFSICPLCTQYGKITCPDGLEVFCENKIQNETEPKCIFLGKSYVPGCWMAAGYKKMDLSLLNFNLPSSAMVKITGDGQVYTLDREIIGCRKVQTVKFEH